MLAALSEEEQARLVRLTEDLSKSPATAAAEQKLKADRIKRLAETLAAIAAQTDDAAVNGLLALGLDATTKRDYGAAGRAGPVREDSMPESGGAVWRSLWEAARRYSTELAYPDAPFPPTRPDMLCVLCHQPLSAEAIQRMTRFEAFIKDDTERQAQEAEVKLAARSDACPGR